ncbi:acyl-CoA dehydratase activase-related protein [Caldicellulosiruptoraceae bacterium PP1]
MKIGIPQALLYYYYLPFWERLFTELGFEVYESGLTTKDILDNGSKAAVADICAPIKIYTGHVIDCLNNSDFVFIPRFSSIQKNEYFCPKFMGLPDIIVGTVENSEKKIISPIINDISEDICDPRSYDILIDKFGFSYRELNNALKKANKVFTRFKKLLHNGLSLDKALFSYKQNFWEEYLYSIKKNGEINIAVLGYVYNLYDPFISLDVVKKLEELNVNIFTFEMVNHDDAYKQLSKYRKKLFWTFSNRVLGAGLYYLNNNIIDGMIHVTAFGCGPDAIVGKFLQYECDERSIPFTTLRIDEHTGEGHLVTRIEAFTDMIKRKKAQTLEVKL